MSKTEKPINTFDDYEEMEGFYLDRLGDYKDARDEEIIEKKGFKKLQSDVMEMLIAQSEDIKRRTLASLKASTVETKEFKKAFNEEHNSGVVQKTKSTFSVIGSVIKKALSPIKVLAIPFKPLVNKINSKLPPKTEILDTTEQPKRLEQGQDTSVSDTSSPAPTAYAVADEVVEEKNLEKNSQQKE